MKAEGKFRPMESIEQGQGRFQVGMLKFGIAMMELRKRAGGMGLRPGAAGVCIKCGTDKEGGAILLEDGSCYDCAVGAGLVAPLCPMCNDSVPLGSEHTRTVWGFPCFRSWQRLRRCIFFIFFALAAPAAPQFYSIFQYSPIFLLFWRLQRQFSQSFLGSARPGRSGPRKMRI
eukprot:gene20140-biopygen17558